jgi:hypothetical protein
MKFSQWFKRTYGYPGKDSSFTSRQIDEEQEKIRQKQEQKEKTKDNDITMDINERKARVRKFLNSNKSDI